MFLDAPPVGTFSLLTLGLPTTYFHSTLYSHHYTYNSKGNCVFIFATQYSYLREESVSVFVVVENYILTGY